MVVISSLPVRKAAGLRAAIETAGHKLGACSDHKAIENAFAGIRCPAS